HIFDMLPKFHPEFNPIEKFWGAFKCYTRENCNYSLPGLQKTVPESFQSVSLDLIKRYFWRCFRGMDGYRQGLFL
ncbi:hypothetical protein BCR33DRAFT_674678, partial [Rhizoclosmatium globosum]